MYKNGSQKAILSESGSDLDRPPSSSEGIDNRGLFVVELETGGQNNVGNGGEWSDHRGGKNGISRENNNNNIEPAESDDDMDDGNELTLDEAEEHQTPDPQQHQQQQTQQQQAVRGRCSCCSGLLRCWRRCVAESRQTFMDAKEYVAKIHRRRILCRLCSMKTLKKRLPCIEWIPKYR